MHYYSVFDVETQMLDFLGGSGDQRAVSIVRRSIQEVYRNFPNKRNWTYFYEPGRLTTSEIYNTGTIEYDYTGGTYERMVTLTSGTWPTDAASGFLTIENRRYDIDERKSSTVVTLTSTHSPASDIASGTTYEWHRDIYTLPVDYRKSDVFQDFHLLVSPVMVTASEWQKMQASQVTSGQPRMVAIIGDPKVPGRLAAALFPPPDDIYQFDYIYQRRPLELKTINYTTGTVTNSGVTFTGSGTAWTQDMVGNVLTIGTSTALPDGWEGTSPYVERHVVKKVNSATELEVYDTPTGTYSGVKYRLSSRIDLEDGAMYTAFLRAVEYQIAAQWPRDDVALRARLAEESLISAREADARFFTTPDQVRYIHRDITRTPVNYEMG